MDNHTIILLAATLGGLLLGVLLSALLLRRRTDEAVFSRTRDLETELASCQSAWELREAGLIRELDYLRSQQEELKSVLRDGDQQRTQQQHQLGDVRQELAAAREKLQFLGDVQQQLRRSEQAAHTAQNELTELKTRLEQERQNFAEQLKLLQDAKLDLSKEFENIANKIFDHKQQQFSSSSKSLLETTLDPLRLQLNEFRRKVEDVYEKETADRNRLAGQVLELQKQTQKIGEDAINLAQALKGNSKVQGNWGEVVLERLLEQSGLQKGREYDTQISFTDETGSRRMPDVIVHLPENKDIIIDAKVSLVDYEKYCNTDDDLERQRYLTAHVASLRNHIKQLSLKDYEKLDGVKSLDFVFIFVPVEAAFLLALQHEPGLSHEAYDRRIILVSPTNLLAILRTVENIWRYEKQNRNAERIARDAGALHDRFVLLLESLDSVGNYLNKTREAYDTVRKRLQTGQGNLVKRVDDIRRLGAKTKKRIDRELIDDTPLEDEQLLEDLPEDLPDESTENAADVLPDNNT
ncbi:MAG TPA: DNA recombination protein RmuC [Cellvibrio sp.]|nr:DNA recombination protein RmuC [Cellvibrio sp.]